MALSIHLPQHTPEEHLLAHPSSDGDQQGRKPCRENGPVTPTTPLVDTTMPPTTPADTTPQQADAATHPATTARTKEPGRGLSDPSFATCLHPNGPRTFLL